MNVLIFYTSYLILKTVFMLHTFTILFITAISVGFIHTLLGPDHYLPFIVMSKARKWSLGKTTIITFLCGIGHVLSAMLLGLIFIYFGFAITKLNFIESFRGVIAAWLLIGFGFAYFIWGIRHAIKNKQHQHFHLHQDGSVHTHLHDHHRSHAHVHEKRSSEITPWILFVIFILGPCEPLIPLIAYPAVKGLYFDVLMITIFFGCATLFVMLGMVLVSVFGSKMLKFPFFERYGNAMAGAIICGSGLAIKFFGV